MRAYQPAPRRPSVSAGRTTWAGVPKPLMGNQPRVAAKTLVPVARTLTSLPASAGTSW